MILLLIKKKGSCNEKRNCSLGLTVNARALPLSGQPKTKVTFELLCGSEVTSGENSLENYLPTPVTCETFRERYNSPSNTFRALFVPVLHTWSARGKILAPNREY